MGYNFLPCDRNQLYLLPPALQDWLPEGDLAWFLLDAVAQRTCPPLKRRIDGMAGAKPLMSRP